MTNTQREIADAKDTMEIKGTFEYLGRTWTWAYDERGYWLVSSPCTYADTDSEEDGIPAEEWPSDARVSREIGRQVHYHDSVTGESHTHDEAIYRAKDQD
jgi:hypothetical protein